MKRVTSDRTHFYPFAGKVDTLKILDLIAAPDPTDHLDYQDSIKRAALSPEKLLMVGVLEDAIDAAINGYYRDKYSYRTHHHAKCHVKEDALRWLFVEYNPEWIFSFHGICGFFGVDVECARRAIKKRITKANAKAKYSHKVNGVKVNRIKNGTPIQAIR